MCFLSLLPQPPTQAAPRLYIACEDLKDRYCDQHRGRQSLRAYVKSVERVRKLSIAVERKENGTVEFTFSNMQEREALAEAKQDIQGEVCSVSELV